MKTLGAQTSCPPGAGAPTFVGEKPALPAIQPAFVSLIDLGETLFRLIGVEATATRLGRNLMPLVGHRSRPADWPQTAYGVYDLYNGMSFAIRAIRTEDYKYVWNPQDINELYHLQADPHEMQNLAGSLAHQVIQANLHHQLIAWLTEVGDDFLDHIEYFPPAGTILATGQAGP